MAVHNCEDIGVNLQKIVTLLLQNDNLVNLLYYEGKDPLNEEPLTAEQKREKVYEKLLKVIPRVGPKETAKSIVTIRVTRGRKIPANNEFKNVTLEIENFVPLTQWIIKDDNLRPFAIMGEIQKSLVGRTINGLGKISGGDFDLNFLTDEISCYMQVFNITSYD